MATPLGRKLTNGKPAALPVSPLAAVLERGDRGELVDLPVLGRAFVRVLGHDEAQDVEAEVLRAMEAKQIAFSDATVLAYEAERAKCTLARAVRAPDARDLAFGTLDEWGKVDSDTLGACWHVYGDVRERLAPLDSPTLDERTRTEILAAWSKKNTTLLRSFGVSALAIFLATTECPPASSPTATSSDGGSSSAS